MPHEMSFGSAAAQRLADKVILITGASAGIGESTAREFASAGKGQIKLILTARRVEKLEELKQGLLKEYPNIKVFSGELDVSKTESIQPFFDSLPDEFKEIDILINNAGKALGVDKVGDVSQEDVQEMFQTNVIGMVAVTQAVLPGMKQRNRGDIVQLGSVAGREGYPGGSIYCATKHALRAFTDAMRKELIDTKIRVMEIQPGNVETEFSVIRFKGDKSKADKVYDGTEPLVASDIAEMIVFNCSRRENTVIAQSLVFATNQASPSHIYRKA